MILILHRISITISYYLSDSGLQDADPDTKVLLEGCDS